MLIWSWEMHLLWPYLALLTGMGLTLWLRNGDTTSKYWGSLGGSTGVSAGSTGCFFFFCLISFQRGIWTGGGGGTRGQSLTVVNITGWGWLWDNPDWRSFSDASAWRNKAQFVNHATKWEHWTVQLLPKKLNQCFSQFSFCLVWGMCLYYKTVH